MKRMLLFVLCFSACAEKPITPTVTIMSINQEQFRFAGSVRTLPRARPWDPVRVEFTDNQGKSTETSVPIDPKLMEQILRLSNFCPSESMMHAVASLFFQGGNSICPDGDDFLLKEGERSLVSEINAVDRGGQLWRIKVVMEGEQTRFSARKKKMVYSDLKKMGGS
jgi:hypothetical protein